MGRFLDNKVVVITGAAGGLGLAVARRFHNEGASVVLADADEAKVSAEAAQIAGEKGRAIHVRCNPTSRLDLNNLLAASLDAFDRVDILVNAVTEPCFGGAMDIDEETFDRAMNVNLRSAFMLTQQIAKHMVARAKDSENGKITGSILHFSALHGERSMPDRFALSVAMAGLDQLTRGFAVALAPYGVRVNGIAPGGVTGRFIGHSAPEVRKAISERTPMSRLGEPDELAGTALMMVSDATSFVTGQILFADGGRAIYEMPLPLEEK